MPLTGRYQSITTLTLPHHLRVTIGSRSSQPLSTCLSIMWGRPRNSYQGSLTCTYRRNYPSKPREMLVPRERISRSEILCHFQCVKVGLAVYIAGSGSLLSIASRSGMVPLADQAPTACEEVHVLRTAALRGCLQLVAAAGTCC